MGCLLLAVCFNANDPRRLSRFWADRLGWEVLEDAVDCITLPPR